MTKTDSDQSLCGLYWIPLVICRPVQLSIFGKFIGTSFYIFKLPCFFRHFLTALQTYSSDKTWGEYFPQKLVWQKFESNISLLCNFYWQPLWPPGMSRYTLWELGRELNLGPPKFNSRPRQVCFGSRFFSINFSKELWDWNYVYLCILFFVQAWGKPFHFQFLEVHLKSVFTN